MSRVVALDYETTGLSTYKGARAFTYNLTWCDTGEYSVYDEDDPLFKKVLKEVCEDPNVEKVAHNMKFELRFTRALGIQMRGKFHCTMIMHAIIDNLRRHGLDAVAEQYGDIQSIMEWQKADSTLTSARRIYKTYDKIPKPVMKKYQFADGERCALIFSAMYPIIRSDPVMLREYEMEMDLIVTTERMEHRGIMLAKDEAIKLVSFMEKEVNSIDLGINLSSPKQLAKLLYEDKKLPILKRTPTWMPCTDNESLETLEDKCPEVSLILKHRSYTKGIAMVNSYISNAGESGIIHPNLNTNLAATGRESSDNPNMQNISNASTIYKYAVAARKCFRARPGYVLFLKDYSSVEMRLGVQGTGSSRLIEMITNDFDFHDATARAFFKDKYINATGAYKKDLRSRAKNVRFAMFYGAGLDLVCKMLGLPIDEVTKGIAQDKILFPEIYAFMQECTLYARKKGYIETFFGRKLKVPHDRPYVATDYKIQGSAAGVLKRAQIRVDKYLLKETKDEARILLPVHDEIIIEYSRKLLPYKDEILGKVDYLMTNMENITVPLKVETEYTSTLWANAKEV